MRRFYGLAPVSVETQNFVSVHEESRPFLESRRGAIVQYSKNGVATREIEQIETNITNLIWLIWNIFVEFLPYRALKIPFLWAACAAMH